MKKCIPIMAAFIVIFQSSCFWDEQKNNNNSLMLLALLNQNNTQFTVCGQRTILMLVIYNSILKIFTPQKRYIFNL